MAKPDMFAKLPQWLNLEESDHMNKPMETTISGTIPKWINGSLYRNGSGLYKIGDTSWNHVFDGFAVLQRWTIKDGAVTYLGSILDSETYKNCSKQNRIVGLSFGSNFPDPCKTIFKRLFHTFVPDSARQSDNTAVNIVEFGDRLFALTETPFINEISPDSLMVKTGKLKVLDVLSVHLGTAHPFMLKDGTMVYFGTNMNYKKAYNFIMIPPQPASSKNPFIGAKVVATAPSRWKMNISYTHSFGMTENYFIQLEQPLAMNIPKLATMNITGTGVAECMIAHNEESLDFLVLSRKTGAVSPIRYKGPNGFVFHFINCYEDKGHIVCDVSFYPGGTDAINILYLESLANKGDVSDPDSPNACLARFVLPLNIDEAENDQNLVTLPDTTATAQWENNCRNVVCLQPEYITNSPSAELPRINDAFNAVKYRYFYSTCDTSDEIPQITKFDMQQKTWKSYEVSKKYRPGEPVFIPRPGATQEDDGVVLSTMVACSPDIPSYLVVMDAQSFTELGRASLPTTVKMSLTFHGNFTKRTF